MNIFSIHKIQFIAAKLQLIFFRKNQIFNSSFFILPFFGAKKEAKKHSPHQGLPSRGGCNRADPAALVH
jgi:hypothetical protein